MPIYEYQCAACGHTFDTLQKIGEAMLTRCPECGAESLRKLISPSAFRLKGGGWYETDFKTGNKKNLAGGADAATSSGSTATPAASSKPASTSTGDSK
jgi:putative FmdB family regulatory protein